MLQSFFSVSSVTSDDRDGDMKDPDDCNNANRTNRNITHPTDAGHRNDYSVIKLYCPSMTTTSYGTRFSLASTPHQGSLCRA